MYQAALDEICTSKVILDREKNISLNINQSKNHLNFIFCFSKTLGDIRVFKNRHFSLSIFFKASNRHINFHPSAVVEYLRLHPSPNFQITDKKFGMWKVKKTRRRCLEVFDDKIRSGKIKSECNNQTLQI